MSKARIMGAASSGSNYGVNKNSPGNGNGKWQGLPPITNMRSLLIPYVNTRARGNNRNVVFSMNQLGGVGRMKNVFGTSADGAAPPPQDLTPCDKYAEALLDGDDGRPSLRSTLRGAIGRTDRSFLGSNVLTRFGGSEEITILQDAAAEAARKLKYPIRGSKKYKRTLYQGAVPPLAGKDGSKDAYIDYQTAMFQWAADPKINIDRVFFDFSSLDTYKQQTIENLVEILKDVPPSIQVGVLNEAQPDFVFQTNRPDLQKTPGGLNPDPATWITPDADCSDLLKNLVTAGTKKCIGAAAGGSGKACCKTPIDTDKDYANGDGSCKCTNGYSPDWPGTLGCWTKEVGTGKDKECQNPIKGSGCPNQLQVSFAFIAEVNRALQAAHQADGKNPEQGGGYITCVIADKENGDYAQNILLSLACAHTILRPSLPGDDLKKCMEVGLAGQGSMTPGGIIVSSLVYCCENDMKPDPGSHPDTNPSGAKTIEGMFLDGTGTEKKLKAPYDDILITTYPELYWYMNDLKPLGCVGCDHTLSADSLKAKSSKDCLEQANFSEDHPVYQVYNKFFDHTTMSPNYPHPHPGAGDIYSQCLNSSKFWKFDEQLCKCLGCVSCKYDAQGNAPNKNIPYQRYGPYGTDDPGYFATEIWYTTDANPDPYRARLGTARDLFTTKGNLYTMRAMFSNEISHNWGEPGSALRIDGQENNEYSCIARRFGADTCGTFDGYSNWSWEKFSEFLDSFAQQPATPREGWTLKPPLQELAIYEWQFVPHQWLEGTAAKETMKPYKGQ